MFLILHSNNDECYGGFFHVFVYYLCVLFGEVATQSFAYF